MEGTKGRESFFSARGERRGYEDKEGGRKSGWERERGMRRGREGEKGG